MTGIELIEIERQEQINEHGYTDDFVNSNPKYYSDYQIPTVARCLLWPEKLDESKMHPLEWAITMGHIEHWDERKLKYMANKSYTDRLIIAGALIAAELDRINQLTI